MQQLSNIAGEVKRLTDTHEAHLKDNGQKDYSELYLEKIKELIDATFADPKNDVRRRKELDDEVSEIREYLQGERTSDYILRYWEEYTKAIA